MDNVKHKDLTFWISIISPIIMIAVSYTTLNTTVKHQEGRISRIENQIQNDKDDYLKRFETLDAKFADIQVRLAEIHKDILYLTQKEQQK